MLIYSQLSLSLSLSLSLWLSLSLSGSLLFLISWHGHLPFQWNQPDFAAIKSTNHAAAVKL